MPREMRAMQTELDDIQTLKSEMAEIRLKIGINQELMDRNKKLDDTAQALHQTISRPRPTIAEQAATITRLQGCLTAAKPNQPNSTPAIPDPLPLVNSTNICATASQFTAILPAAAGC
jgi:hypothetical protein